jgi:hypothetical protein
MNHPMTPDEGIALQMKSDLDDACNGVAGLLRCLAERTDPKAKDAVQGNLKEFYERVADRLAAASERSGQELTEYMGEARRRELSRQQIQLGVSVSATWRGACPQNGC